MIIMIIITMILIIITTRIIITINVIQLVNAQSGQFYNAFFGFKARLPI